jgi:hypothetical protein
MGRSRATAWLSLQARSVGLFGTRLSRFGLGVAALLLASVFFLPIAALLAWLIVVSITMMRRHTVAVRPLDASASPAR